MGCAASGSPPKDAERLPDAEVQTMGNGASVHREVAGSAVTGLVAPSKAAFAKLPTNLVGHEALPQPWKILASRNRYVDILPTPHTRVRLQTVNGDPVSEYINANFIRGLDGSEGVYIAAQGPKPETTSDFWRMVWEQNVMVIVMLTGLVEQGKTKCERYWPKDLGSSRSQAYGDFHVATLSAAQQGAYVRSNLQLRRGKDASGEVRDIHHFWYNTWPDHGVPTEVTGVSCMYEEVRLHGTPWLLHCSAGIGRTGTFLGIDMGVRQLANGEVPDVLGLIQRMRQDRGGMVQTEAQAEFIYRALAYIGRSKL